MTVAEIARYIEDNYDGTTESEAIEIARSIEMVIDYGSVYEQIDLLLTGGN